MRNLILEHRPLLLLALVACGGPPGPAREEPPLPAVQVDAAPPAPPPEVAKDDSLYALDEALADAQSGPLTHIGSGPMHGLFRINSCAYRNERVIVVDAYCTRKEMKAFRVDVFSPTRGRVRIYAEAEAPISGLTRSQYFTFKAETEPAPPADSGLPPFSLTMSFPELQAYEKARYEKFMDACWGGVEIHKPQGGCLRNLEPRAHEWAERNDPFLAAPPAEWYQLVKDMRALAATYAKRG